MSTDPKSGRSRLLRLAVSAPVALAVFGLAGCGPKPPPPDPAATTAQLATLTPAQLQKIRLVTVAPGDFHRAIWTTGVVDFDNDQATSVIAPMSGPVSRLLVEPGQAVRAGQPLALVASPDYAAAIATYRKAVYTAANARRIAETDKDLAEHNGVSAREAQQAQTDAENAESDRAAALKALKGLDLSAADIHAIQDGRPLTRMDGEIRSPISGTVVEKLITPGQLLQAGSTASFTVANLSRMWVNARLSNADLAQVHVGDPVQVETNGVPPILPGVVDNIGQIVNADTRAVGARVAVNNPGGLLKKQMYVRVRIQSREASHGLLVPVSAILRDDQNLPFVYVAARGGFARRHVTLGPRTGDAYEIPEGLQAGDRVVADGGLFVQFMQNQ